jgi:hypothetical protein
MASSAFCFQIASAVPSPGLLSAVCHVWEDRETPTVKSRLEKCFNCADLLFTIIASFTIREWAADQEIWGRELLKSRAMNLHLHSVTFWLLSYNGQTPVW